MAVEVRFRDEGFDRIVRQKRRIRPCLVRQQKKRAAEYRQYKKEVGERMKWIERFRGRSSSNWLVTWIQAPVAWFQGILRGMVAVM